MEAWINEATINEILTYAVWIKAWITENWIAVAVFCAAFVPSYLACRYFTRWLSSNGRGLGAATVWLMCAVMIAATAHVGLNVYVESGYDHRQLVSLLMAR